MDLKNLTSTQIEKGLTDSGVVKPSTASGDHPPSTPVPTQPQRNLNALLTSMQLGKVFDVIVAKVEGNTVFLNIPGSPADAPLLQAEMKTALPVGTRLTLQLTGEAAKPQLTVIATPNSPQDPISQNLRTGLQQQQALPPLLANLNILAKSPTKLASPLPTEVLDVSRQVVQQLPDSRQVSQAQGLRHALSQAGPFLEHALATNTVATGARPELKLPITASLNPAPAQAKANIPSIAAGGVVTEEEATPPKVANPALLQAIESVAQAMRQQPIQDVRGNLLRLANLLRNVNEQNQQQKALNQATGESADPAKLAKGIEQGAARSLVGLTPSSTASSSGGSAASTASQTGAGLAGQTARPPQAGPEFSSAVRSQTPTPQAQANNASLLAMLSPDRAIEELLAQVEGALSRIQVQQLQTVATEQQQRPGWVVELPVRSDQGIDLFDLRIQRDHENHDPDDPKAPWTVTLAFDLDRMGPVRVQVTLYGEDRISAVIWAEHRATSILFNHYLSSLESRLRQVGLDVGQLNCRCGKPDSPPPSTEPRLVDEKV